VANKGWMLLLQKEVFEKMIQLPNMSKNPVNQLVAVHNTHIYSIVKRQVTVTNLD